MPKGQDSPTLGSSCDDITDWDSVGHLSLCGVLEVAFDMCISTGEFAELNSVRGEHTAGEFARLHV